MSTPIAAAVEPLRAEAIQAAEDNMRARIARMVERLQVSGMDLNVAAPRPNTNMSRADYKRLLAVHDLYAAISRPVQSSRRMRDPLIVRVDEERCEQLIADAREMADTEYSAFIAKLESKVGEHSAATLTGNHVWGYSVLTVTTPAGCERWKTQQIINVSSLGKLFPQWPSRKVK